MQNNVLKVYDSAGPYGHKLAELKLETKGSKSDELAYYPNMPDGASTYFFNLGDLMGLNRNNPCTLFESENDYVQLSPQRVVGADGIGNHIGYTVFKKHTYTFWISFNQQGYILPHSANTYDWEAQIVCVQ